MTTSDVAPHEGGCLCGATRYRVRSAPARVTICHCTFCQRMTGSGYLVEPVFARDDFSVTGKPVGHVHTSDGSGAAVTVMRCADCGTNLWLDLARFPDVVGIIGGTFDDPNWFARSGPDVRHIFARSAQRGTVFPSGVDIYRGPALSHDGSPTAPIRLARPTAVTDIGLPQDAPLA